MKTQGIEIGKAAGYLVLGYGRSVPDAFWGRLKHEMSKRLLLDAFAADYRAERETVVASLPSLPTSEQYLLKADAEERLFRRWVERCELVTDRWPWDAGWTPEAVDAYLAAPIARAA